MAEPVDLSQDRALVWVEYLVLMEAYDRTLPGGWLPDDQKAWAVAIRSLPESIAYARRQHARVLVALRALLGRPMVAEEEVVIVNAAYEGLDHDGRVALLKGRSVLDELVGRDLLSPEVARPS
jgi:hypothetical protein